MQGRILMLAAMSVFAAAAVETYPLSDFLELGVRTRPGQCLMNLAGITSAGRTVPGAAAVERHGLGDGYQTKWGLEIGHLREGASCVYRGFDFSTPEARALEFHVSSGMQDSCMELYDADGGTLLGTGGLVRAYTKAAQDAFAAARIVTFAECVDITVSVEYPLYDQLVHWLSEQGIQVITTDFAGDVALDIRVLAASADAVQAAIADLTHGQAEMLASAAAYRPLAQ